MRLSLTAIRSTSDKSIQLTLTDKSVDPALLADQVVDLSIKAGREILRYYRSDYKVETKSDSSPVTEADIAANDVILTGLANLSPGIPIISEETAIPDYSERSTWHQYWLIDPLDGTKSFVRGDDEFTVNIALIDGNIPVLGVVHSPAEQRTYWGVNESGAWCSDNEGTTPIRVWQATPDRLRMIAPNSRGYSKAMAFKDNLELNDIACEISHSSSSIKFCRVAEGNADIFPSFGTTCEWDTAAAQCVVECAGGSVVDLSGNRITYNKADAKLRNPPFVVSGVVDVNWQRYLPTI